MRNNLVLLVGVIIFSFFTSACSKVDTDIFIVEGATLLPPFEKSGLDDDKDVGTFAIRAHRLSKSKTGWVLGIRRHTRNAWIGTQQRYVTKLTLYFPEKPISDKEYDLAKDRDKVRVIYSSINPQYVEGCAADASFGKVNFKWLSKTKFEVDVNAAFDMKYELFCRAELVNEMFEGEVISFNELTPWLGVPNELDSFEGMHQELRRE